MKPHCLFPVRAFLLPLTLSLAAGSWNSAAQPPASSAPASATPSIPRLKALVEAAEKALEAQDDDGASDRVDEAEALIAAWPEDLMGKPEVASLLERLKAVEDDLEEEEEVAPEVSEDGLRIPTEVVTLSGEDLIKEEEQVDSAEAGAVFDFPIDLNDKVLTWIRIFSTERKGFIEGALSRGTRYLPMVRQIFEEEGVPKDLAYLAVIESGFKNTANSRAKALGMWQFIRSTGRLYGLSGNAWLEERKDPVKSARASARYLRNLYESSGDWYLALVGYNAGPLTTERAIQNLGTRNFWDMARSRWLRNETKNYVPELLAAILVGRNPERYGLQVVPMPPFAFETVVVEKATSLSVLAAYAGTQVDVLKDLNPELLRNSTPQGKYTLRVPPGASGITARALARIPASQRLDFDYYVIKKGDTLRSVASRFDISPEDLLSFNNLSKKSFRPGKRIQVPPPAPVPVDQKDLVELTPQERARLERPVDPIPAIPEPPEGQTPTEAVAPPAPVAEVIKPSERAEVPSPAERAKVPNYHVVKSGETLFSIGIRYGIDPKLLAKWNKVKRNRITVGQRLHLKKN